VVEHYNDTVGVTGSNPVPPTIPFIGQDSQPDTAKGMASTKGSGFYGWRGAMAGIESLVILKPVIERIAREHGASNIRVFGSFARGEAREDSDLDLVVDMAPNRTLLDSVGLVQDLQESLGRHVDVVTEPSLHRLLRAKILSEAVPL